MKKFLALILTLALIMSMSIVAFAETVTVPTDGANELDNTNNQVSNSVVVNAGATAQTVYCVTVTWGTLEFNYTFGNGVWNPENHQYNDGAGAGWYLTDPANAAASITSTIVVENHSNAAVRYSAMFGSNANVVKNGVTAALTNNTDVLESADDDQYRNNGNQHNDGNNFTCDGPVGTITLTVSGKPDTVVSDMTVGTITVTITPNT